MSRAQVTTGEYADWFDAVRNGFVHTITEMAEKNAGVLNLTNYNGGTALHEAVTQGQAHIAALLLQLGADPDPGDEAGGTPLHVAAMSGDTECMKLLLDKGAQVEARQGDNISTPLHCAAHRNCLAAAQLLVERGADLQAKDGRGKTALQIAQGRKSKETAQFLEREMTRAAFAAEAKTLTTGLEKPISTRHSIVLRTKKDTDLLRTKKDAGVLRTKKDAGVLRTKKDAGVLRTKKDNDVLRPKKDVTP